MVSTRRDHLEVAIFVTGHDRFVKIMPTIFEGLSGALDASCRERDVDGWEITLSESLLPASPAVHLADQPEPTAPSGESFEIDLPTREDSAGIARCFLQIYGRNYIHSEVFSPRRYWAKVESGELIPVIARNAAGEVVGHVALEREHGAIIAERGQAVVLPSFRGKHLLETMTERLSARAIDAGLEGIFAQPVTIHTFSQRNDERAGMAVCAALLGTQPENILPRGVTIPTRGQRQSLLVAFRFLEPPGERIIHPPAVYQEKIQGIYASLGAPMRLSDAVGAPPPPRSTIDIRMDRGGTASIRVESIGATIAAELGQAFRDLLGLGAEHVQLSAPMQDARLPVLSDAARSLGFYFCGIGPLFMGDHDALMLQYEKHPIDATRLQLFADQTNELVQFIEDDRRAVSS